jgi:protein-L-isoaspartate(D-aspartate) O-methyltransferase
MGNKELVDSLLREGYLKTPRIAEAFRKVDRGFFVLRREEAYSDYPLPIGGGQTISAPHMVAIMIELLEPKKTDTVLEIGAGSGYNAAILAFLTKKVYSLEIDSNLAGFARKNLRVAGLRNVEVMHRDGSLGIPGKKFDKIIFTCSVKEIPGPVIDQLKDPGILQAPVGSNFQDLIVLRKEKGCIRKENHGGCVFVPLRKHGA